MTSVLVLGTRRTQRKISKSLLANVNPSGIVLPVGTNFGRGYTFSCATFDL
jgi:hypothetical protein